ncbi:hypothetical protein OT109_04875 [Phycisphaeraceae bacterium D3-23]
MKSPTALAVIATFLLTLLGCGSDASTDAEYPDGVAPIDETQRNADTPDDDGHADDPAAGDQDADSETDNTHTVEGLNYTVPEGWTVGGPKPMRTLTLMTADGIEIAVGFWPNGVGGLEPNLTRWLGQAGYNPADTDAVQDARDGFTDITLGDAQSIWMPLLDGTGGTPMIGVWAPRGENPTAQSETWTLKITGPADTLRDSQDELRAWVESLRFD